MYRNRNTQMNGKKETSVDLHESRSLAIFYLVFDWRHVALISPVDCIGKIDRNIGRHVHNSVGQKSAPVPLESLHSTHFRLILKRTGHLNLTNQAPLCKCL